MLRLISSDDPNLRSLFENVELNYRFAAIAAGTSPGKVWVSDVNNPHSAFIWDGAYCLYFGGDADDEAFNEALGTLLTETVLVEAQQRRLQILKLHATSERWNALIESLLQSYSMQRRARVLYGLNRLVSAQHIEPPMSLPNGLGLNRIDADLISQAALLHLDDVRGEIESGWMSIERFLKDGLGYAVVHETDGVVAWCTAEYVSMKTCGVGIETIEAYQGQGLATALALAFVQEASTRGWQVYWDSWLANTPSVRVAEKAGFKQITEYDVQLVVLE